MPDDPGRLLDTTALAQRLGLSRWAVSRALNDQPGVSADTRARVRAAAAQAGFQPNAHARALRGGGRGNDGPSDRVVVRVPSLRDPAWVTLAAGLCEGLLIRGWQAEWTLVHREEPPAKDADAWEGYVARRVTAVLALGATMVPPTTAAGTAAGSPAGRELRRRGTPVIFVEPEWDGEPDGYPVVRTDHRAGANLITAHLAAAGHQRVELSGFTSPREFPRAEALRRACEARGLRCDSTEVAATTRGASRPVSANPGPNDPPPGEPARPVRRGRATAAEATALVASDDLTALRVLCQRRAEGRKVPADCAVIGYGDDPAGPLATPALTTLDPQRPQMIARTLELLDELLRDPGGVQAGCLWISPLLRCRGSVGMLPGAGA